MVSETSISQTLEDLAILIEQVDITQASVDRLQAMANTTVDRVEAEWSELEWRVSTLLAQVNTAKETFNTESEQVAQSLSQLHNTVENRQQKVDESYSEAKKQLSHLEEKLGKSQEAINQTIQATLESLKMLQNRSETISPQLESALTQSSTQVKSNLVSELSQYQAEIGKRQSDLESCVSDACIPAIAEQGKDFTTQLDTVVSTLSTKLEQLGGLTEVISSEALKPFKEVEDQYDRLMNNVNQLKDDIEFIVDRIERTSKDAARTLDLLEDGVKTSSSGALVVVGVLNDVQAILG